MSNNKLILDYGKDLIVGGLLITYIITDAGAPELIKSASNSLPGLVALGMLIIMSFTFFHSIIGVLAIVLIFKLVVSNRTDNNNLRNIPNNSIDFQQGVMEPQNVLTDDFNARVVSAEAPIVVQSIDNTLEQEVIANMAPLSTSSSSSPSKQSNLDNVIQPVLTNFTGSVIN